MLMLIGRSVTCKLFDDYCIFRFQGYVVQLFLVGHPASCDTSILQGVCNRRAIYIDPWKHTSSSLHDLFWAPSEVADAAVIVVCTIPCSCCTASLFKLPVTARLRQNNGG
jgi:hypothetical protein